MSKNILIIDDDPYICKLLENFLRKEGYHTVTATTGKKGLQALKDGNIDVVLCDIRLPDMNGLELLPLIHQVMPKVPVIMITAYAEIRNAVDTIRSGAFEYVTKPIRPDEILEIIRDATTEESRQKRRVRRQQEDTFISGESPGIQKALKESELVAPTNMSVLIQGETGSGKEYIARFIHRNSERKDQLFVAIDCGAIPKELAASELFGHVKGSFTGAISNKTGYFEQANGGTIFLDEIGNLPYETQVKLLRAIQQKVISRVGDTKDIPVDVRIICATNRDLMQAVKEGHFREDLYHRINEFKILLPPLRDRGEDLMIFARHFLYEANRELNKDVKGFSPKAEEIFRKYHWHGNLRELRNVIMRSVLMAAGDQVTPESLPDDVRFMSDAATMVTPETELKDAAREAERKVIRKALTDANFNKTRAARILKIDRKTLYNKLKQLGIEE